MSMLNGTIIFIILFKYIINVSNGNHN